MRDRYPLLLGGFEKKKEQNNKERKRNRRYVRVFVCSDQQRQVFGRRGVENSAKVLRDQPDIDEKGEGPYRRLREER